MNEFLAFIFGMPFVILAIYFCYANPWCIMKAPL